ncbi:MAG TPA: hypothetical protein VMY37_05255 [Thermoguttaceae bacterium]|nr:hypothetical protein [Thermoguttaceae bacterium]HUT88878.1 hypothetical protein [Thermoguttaceae bacterium]
MLPETAKSLLAAVCVTAAISDRSYAQYNHSQLKQLAAQEIASGAVEYDPTTIRFEGDTMSWLLGSVNLDRVGGDVVNHAVYEQFRVAVIAHEKRKRSQRRFWAPILRDVERVIHEELEYRKSVRIPDEARITHYGKRIDAIYTRAMERYAASRGYRAVREKVAYHKGFFDRHVTLILPGAETVHLILRTRYRLLSIKPGAEIVFSVFPANAEIMLRVGAYYYRRPPDGPLREIRVLHNGTYHL